MRRLSLVMAIITTTLCAAINTVYAFDFDSISGKWVSVTPGAGLGEPIWFHPAFEGYDVILPFMNGQASVGRVVDGHAAAHVKVSSRDGQQCWYYVGIINDREMTWALRDANSPNCPPPALFRRDP